VQEKIARNYGKQLVEKLFFHGFCNAITVIKQERTLLSDLLSQDEIDRTINMRGSDAVEEEETVDLLQMAQLSNYTFSSQDELSLGVCLPWRL